MIRNCNEELKIEHLIENEMKRNPITALPASPKKFIKEDALYLID